MPLFIDFLRFESVRPLWERKTAATDADWRAAYDLVLEELRCWRLELIAHAYTLTRDAAEDPERDTRFSQLDFEEGGEADLLAPASLASTIVSCAFTDCRTRTRGIWRWWELPECSDRWVGTLQDVLQHQHLAHNSVSCLGKKDIMADTQAPIRLSAPLEIICTITALLDLAQLDPATATYADLDDFQRDIGWWVWENSATSTRYFSTWRELVSLASHVRA